MKRLLIIVGLVLLGGALVFLNQGVRKSAVPDKDEDEQAQQSKATPETAITPADPNSILPAEETVGDSPAVKHRIQVGWVYSEANQQKPETLTMPLQAVRDYVKQSGGTVSAEIVDLDVPVEDRTPAAQAVTSLGIRMDGHPIFGSNVSELPFPPSQLARILQGATGRR